MIMLIVLVTSEIRGWMLSIIFLMFCYYFISIFGCGFIKINILWFWLWLIFYLNEIMVPVCLSVRTDL